MKGGGAQNGNQEKLEDEEKESCDGERDNKELMRMGTTPREVVHETKCLKKLIVF